MTPDEFRDMMESIADATDQVLNGVQPTKRTIGFALLLFPYDHPTDSSGLITNGVGRDDIIAMLTEQLKRLKGAN